MYHDIDSDMLRAVQLLQELSEQNARNKDMSVKLVAMAGQLKVCLSHDAFVLRLSNVVTLT